MAHHTLSHGDATWHASLPNLTMTEFLDRLEAKGWPAEDAFIAYTEWREVGSPFLERMRQDGPAGARDHTLARARLGQALETMERPEDLAIYRRHLAAIAGGWRPQWGTDDAPNETVVLDLAAGRVWQLLEHQHAWNDTVFARRYRDAVEPEEWRTVREVGMDWDDVRQSASRDVLRRKQTLTDPPSALSSSRSALKTLVDALEETGVPAFSWPAASGTRPETLTLLAAELQQVNREIQSITGLEGPLLGLGGKVAVSLGSVRMTSGLCSIDRQCLIQTAPDIVWTSAAHEWLHALDGAMSPALDRNGWAQGEAHWFASEGAKARQGTALEGAPQAWGQLLDALRNPDLEQRDREEMNQSLVAGFKERWDPKPGVSTDFQNALLLEFEEAKKEGWDENEAFQRLLPEMRRHRKEVERVENTEPGDTESLHFHTNYALVDLQMVREGLARKATEGSVWMQYRERIDARGANDPETKMFKNYFQEPCEQVAFSFEALLPPQAGRISSDIRQRGSELLSYPLPEESRHQQQAWLRFFKNSEIQNWWQKRRESWAPATAVDESTPQAMAARLQARRARLSDGVVVEPALQAARPRIG